MKKKFTLLVSLLLFITGLVQAQTESDTSLVHIETTDGNEYVGKIVGQDSTKIFLKTDNLGKIYIYKSDIKSREYINKEQIKDNGLWFANPQSTRYFWSPNGYGLKGGEGYYQNIWVLWNQFAYGITDNLSLGGVIIPLFLFAGAPTPVFFTPKISLPLEKEKVNLGAGGLLGTVLGEEETGFGILYGISTFGTPDKNISCGLGYGYTFGEWASSPLININGMLRIANRGYLLTENYYLKTEDVNIVLISLGGRWIIKKAALDFGIVMPFTEMNEFIGIPWLGFTIPFGNTH